jgi:DNA-binding beta-propeller fold protein YncE
MKKFTSASLLVCLVSILPVKSQNKYQIAGKFPVEGNGGWDYVVSEDDSSRVYIAHGNVMQVMNTSTNKIIGTLKGLNGAHGVAICENMNHGYVTSGKDSTFTVFDLNSFNKVRTLPTMGSDPDAVLFDFYTQRLFICNARSNDISVFDVSVDKFIGKIKLDGNPEMLVNDDNGHIFVNIENLSMVCSINASTMKVENKWRLKEGQEPSGLAIDKVNHRLFSVCDNKLMVISDYDKGAVVATVPIGEHPDGAAFDPILKRAYSSNGDGTLTVVQEVDANTFKVIDNVKTQKGARTLTVNNKTHHIYLPVAERGEKAKPSATDPNPRPEVIPNTFVILDVEVK